MLSANSVSRLEYRDKPGKRPDPGISRWIRSELSVAPPRARSLIVTVWGDAIAPHGGGIWLSSLIHLMAPFGVNERLVRTSVYRLVREGWLAARQDGRRSLYRLTDQGALRFAHAYQRIYAAAPYEWNGEWEIVVATSATLDSAERARSCGGKASVLCPRGSWCVRRAPCLRPSVKSSLRSAYATSAYSPGAMQGGATYRGYRASRASAGTSMASVPSTERSSGASSARSARCGRPQALVRSNVSWCARCSFTHFAGQAFMIRSCPPNFYPPIGPERRRMRFVEMSTE